jgi:hypothetical protein
MMVIVLGCSYWGTAKATLPIIMKESQANYYIGTSPLDGY